MTIIEILTKVRKGEQLTADEQAFVGSYDHQKELDSSAAAARKKAEADAAKVAQDLATAQQQLKEAQAKLADADGKGKSETQKLSEQIAALQKQVQEGSAERAKLVRQQKLDDVFRGTGLQFVKEVDGSIMRGALLREFEGLSDEELANADKVTPIVNTFRARNKAVILDTSGHGAGANPRGAGSGGGEFGGTTFTREQIGKMSPAEYEKNREAIGKAAAAGAIA